MSEEDEKNSVDNPELKKEVKERIDFIHENIENESEERGEKKIEELFEQGNKAVKEGEYEEAISYFDEVISTKAFLYELNGELDKAIRCYDELTSKNPEDANLWCLRAMAYEDKGDYENAIRCYNKATSKNPSDTNAWIYKGDSYRAIDEYERAIECYDQAISMEPLYFKPWFGKAQTYRQKGEFEKARVCYKRAVCLSPEDSKDFLNHIKDRINRNKESSDEEKSIPSESF